ncbi:MAG: Rrf2 family transcriptional regulator, partial [Verrucomicrobiae bacterium]|nr:Rrf2 family transcriptional regulator [Verrucomicrobiae bacterium]
MVTSAFIARSVNTNPVVIRRLLALLRQAGLVKSQPGIAGGWQLSAKPDKITLGMVYRAVRPRTVFDMHGQHPNLLCPVGRNVQRVLQLYYQRAEASMEAELDRTT